MNDNKTILAELIEQTAAKVVLLNAGQTAEMEDCQNLFERIISSAGGLEQTSDQWIGQFKNLGENGIQLLDSFLKQQDESIQAGLEQLNCLVNDMQKMLPEMNAAFETIPASNANCSAVTFHQDDIPLLLDFIAEAREHIEKSEAAMLELENNPDSAETLNTVFRAFHTIKGAASFLNLTEMTTLAHAAENLLDMARKGQVKLVGAYSNVTFASMDMLKSMFSQMETAISQNTPYQSAEGVEILLQKLHDCASGKIKVQTLTPSSPAPMEKEILPEADDHKLDQVLAGEKDSSTDRATSKTADEKIKVSTTRLDDLINMTGELAVAQLMIADEVGQNCSSDSNLFRKVAYQNKIVRQLQELSMSMRMVTVQGMFQKMARLVRDLSQKAGKTIEFKTGGEETELDRTIVDKITDPLIHMMRNSVDHGVEPAQERQGKGKSATGHVFLRAYHQAGSIFIEITDDGRGLDRNKIYAKAVERGLIAEGQNVPDDELYKFIFHAGFSTAEKVTDVSGRGVGMDVVCKNIESLSGKIDIRTVPDKGTTFLVRLPLTLAIIDGQIVTVGTQRYIIPINAVVHNVRPSAEQIYSVQNRAQMIKIRDNLIPLVPLYRLFGISDARQNPTEGLLVVVEDDNRKCCLQVDRLLGQQQVVIKSIRGLGHIKGVSGGAVMGDGKVSLILDIPGLINLAQTEMA
jgi:two-component system chemotaxis sensor kinase CheA